MGGVLVSNSKTYSILTLMSSRIPHIFLPSPSLPSHFASHSATISLFVLSLVARTENYWPIRPRFPAFSASSSIICIYIFMRNGIFRGRYKFLAFFLNRSWLKSFQFLCNFLSFCSEYKFSDFSWKHYNFAHFSCKEQKAFSSKYFLTFIGKLLFSKEKNKT